MVSKNAPSKELLEKLDQLVISNNNDFSADDKVILHKMIDAWKFLASFGRLFPWLLAILSSLSALLLALTNIKGSIKGLFS